MKIVYLNGQYQPISEAKISVLDRGFLFGDGIYEVIPVYNGKLFRLQEHLKRLHNSLNATHINIDLTDEDLKTIFETLLEKNPQEGQNQVIYLEITRGSDSFRHHNFPKDIPATIFIQTSKLPEHDKAILAKGKKAIVMDDIRWSRCDIKSISLLGNILANQEAKNQLGEEAIFIRNQQVIEGASSNVFIVKDGVIMTPPLSDYILGGITRDVVLEIAANNALPYQEKNITTDELFQADEVWISSSTREIFPITTLNDQTIGDGAAGPVWHSMIDHYHDFIQKI